MERFGTLFDVDLFSKENITIKTETDEVLGSNASGEVNSELFGTDITVKVELESDGTETIFKEENACEESSYDQGDLQYLDFITAFKSETVIKEEIVPQFDLNKEAINNSQEKLFVSNVCEQSLFSDKPLGHGSSKTKTKRHSCDTCEKSFTQACKLKRHNRIHTGEKPHSCDTCERSFSRLFDLKLHKRIHTGERPFSCDTCEKTFVRASDLKRHTAIHTGEKLFSCDMCGKSFSCSSSLKIHKRIHADNKPFSCNTCNKSFSQQMHLKEHEMIHTGKPYSCDICTKSFLRAIHLKEHKRIHTGEKPFLCDTCSKSFARASDLKRHKKIHTKKTQDITFIDIKEEFPADKVASEIDEDMTSTSEIVVKEESFFWDENNQPHLI